jgi:uncharacterized membrane protein YfcA
VFLIVSSVAIFMLPGINDKAIMLVLGVVLILTSLYFILLSGRIHIRPTLPSQIGIGILSGLMGGFFAMQGPPAVLYFLSSEKDKEHYLAMISAYLLIGNLATALVRSANGFMTREVGVGFLWGIAGVAAGAFLGAKAFKRIPHKVFDYIVYAYIAFSGVVILLNALHR